MRKPKIALAHEFFTQYGGAEKTLEAIAEIFPEAPIYTAKLNPKALPDSLKNRKFLSPDSSLVNKTTKYLFTFMMAPVFESMDFSEYDLIISDGNTWNKGILTRPDQLHITYIHTPPRFLYKYSTESTKRNKWYFKLFFSYLDNILRLWDFVAAQRPDYLLVNSQETLKRVKKFYRRDATIIYPPAEIDYKVSKTRNNLEKPYFIALGRLTRYKNFEQLIQAFNVTQMPLVVVGTGAYEHRLRQLARENIIFKGKVSEDDKHYLLENAVGLINPVEDEDFGIVPVEAMAHGIPVLAHKSGGHLETVVSGVNGMLFTDLSVENFVNSIKEFDNNIRQGKFSKDTIRESVSKYSKERFKREFEEFVMQKWNNFSG